MKKALFLDRDGVINVEKNYVHKIEEFEFVDGIFQLILAAQNHGYLPVIITNQAGIARGYYSEEEFQLLTQWMIGEFTLQGINIARVYHCPYHNTAGVGKYRKASFDRKPNPGMLFSARDELRIDLAQSVLVGDKMSDIEAGRNAGVRNLVLYSDSVDEADLQEMEVFSSLQDITTFLFN